MLYVCFWVVCKPACLKLPLDGQIKCFEWNRIESGLYKPPHILTPPVITVFMNINKSVLLMANNNHDQDTLQSYCYQGCITIYSQVRGDTWCCSLPSISSDLVYWSKTHTVLIIALSLLKAIFSLPLSGHIGTNTSWPRRRPGRLS